MMYTKEPPPSNHLDFPSVSFLSTTKIFFSFLLLSSSSSSSSLLSSHFVLSKHHKSRQPRKKLEHTKKKLFSSLPTTQNTTTTTTTTTSSPSSFFLPLFLSSSRSPFSLLKEKKNPRASLNHVQVQAHLQTKPAKSGNNSNIIIINRHNQQGLSYFASFFLFSHCFV